MIELLETKVYEGREIVAVVVPDNNSRICGACVGLHLVNCTRYLGECSQYRRDDRNEVFWMYVDDAAVARLRGKL